LDYARRVLFEPLDIQTRPAYQGSLFDVNEAEGRTLRQIGAQLGLPWTALSQQLRRSGVPMRRGGPSSHPTSTQRILELRDQGLTWNEVANEVDMTFSGAWSRYRKARPPKTRCVCAVTPTEIEGVLPQARVEQV